MFFIRTAMERDLPAVSALLAETWHATYDPIYGRERVEEIIRSWHGVEQLRPRLSRPSSEFIVADNGERLAAMGYAATSDSDRSLVVLHQLYVLPGDQRTGIGSEMLIELMNAFPDSRRMQCEVEPANRGAVLFYEKHGFRGQKTAIAKGSLEDGVEVSVFEAVLGT
ncbi:GNAT family N-acetyltransferase [Fulvimarina endophytica]|uniref:GNAT family N-acetyltransferase n=1 Tax=Fulvimarina endophytica TaxID=2293836 RepID=A0A371WZE1_9HYPH|nr:GNAT family N-acetyltransferase [Fulvimarina endophytica]RFC62348.1 GNAT family N-acetyltransferase [Fulvimarina endophytica]